MLPLKDFIISFNFSDWNLLLIVKKSFPPTKLSKKLRQHWVTWKLLTIQFMDSSVYPTIQPFLSLTTPIFKG